MAMPVPQKIVLKSSTTMSLNDRFSKIAAVRPPQQTVTISPMGASLKNQRLMQQMANRNLMAMTGKGPVGSRLGAGNIKARLGFGRGFMGNNGSLSFYGTQRRRGMMYSNTMNQRPRRGLTNYRGNPSTRRATFRTYTRGVMRGRGQFKPSLRGGYNNQLNNNQLNNTQLNNYNYGSFRGQGRGRGGVGGGRGGVGRGRGGMRGGRGGQNTSNTTPQAPKKTAEQLDTELEQYMSTS